MATLGKYFTRAGSLVTEELPYLHDKLNLFATHGQIAQSSLTGTVDPWAGGLALWADSFGIGQHQAKCEGVHRTFLATEYKMRG